MAERPPISARTSTETTTEITAFSASFQGPVPPPQVLAGYNHVIPGGAERILAMAERQQAHRQDLESTVVKGNVRAELRGQILAFILGLVAIGGGIALIAYDKDTLGITSIVTAFTALAGVFVYGRYQQARERDAKRREAREAAAQPKLPFPAE